MKKRSKKGTVITLVSLTVGVLAGLLYIANLGDTWNTVFLIIFFLAIATKWVGEAYLKSKKKERT